MAGTAPNGRWQPDCPAPVAPSAARRNDGLPDLRFRALIGAEGWARLPAAVQARFAHRLAPGQAIIYQGEVTECRMHVAGWMLAQAARLIGAPLPLGRDSGTAAVVSVTEDGASGGQVWTRIYARRRGFPQVIHSAKRFAGPTGLEEYLGAGFGIALRVSAQDAGIRFVSDHYFWSIGRLRLRLPRWIGDRIGPGALTIDHQDLGNGCFSFSLTLQHPWLGVLIRQIGHFRDGEAAVAALGLNPIAIEEIVP